MLKFEREGVLEAGAQAIRKLSRSVTAVAFEVSGRDACEVNCVLGEFLDGGQTVCQVAFYAKALKGGVVFALDGPDPDSALRHGREVLSRLGFLLDDVNLKLKPALLDVVLRDIPGIATPADAASQREEKERLLEESRLAREKDPESAEGKRAALKLNAEKRSQAQLHELRGTLERLLQPVADATGDIAVLEGRVGELTAELAAAGERLVAARRERDMSETIRLAAEKRIRELEELLVDVETGKAEVVKMKRKSARLQERLDELEKELEQGQRELAEAREAQEAAQIDADGLRERLAARDGELREREESLEKARAEMAAAEMARQQAVDGLESASRTIDGLKVELAESVSREAEDRELLAAARESLKKARDRVAELDDAVVKSGQDEERFRQLEEQLSGLREDCAQERERTLEQEGRAAAAEARVRELEAALAAAAEPPAATARTEDTGAASSELAARLEDALRVRVGLEASLREASGRIAALEQELRRPAQAPAPPDVVERDARRIAELEKQLAAIAAELERCKAEKAVAPVEREAAEPAATNAKALPHELRPAPKKGADFHPDWDLQGLPCRSAAGVVKAWESVFNVQISLEGYPSQYCTAFLVIVNGDGRKRLFLLFRLKKNKHTLVCVPAREPQDDAALKGAVDEGLAYLRRSGFDMQPLDADHLAGALQAYFSGD